MSNGLIDVDGSLLEGGGQILRIALTISVLSKKPVRIFNIRAGRSKPGLMEQHLKGVELVRDMCNAKVRGAEIGSTEIEFVPGKLQGGQFKAAVRTAGSVSLLLQVALPCTLFAASDTTLILQGGTNTEMAPQIDYTTEVFRPIMEKFGATFNFYLIKRGYFPKGGGEVKINVKPVHQLKAVEMVDQGSITALYGWSFVAGTIPIGLAHTMANSASSTLRSFHRNISIERYKELGEVASGNSFGIVLVAETSTGCILGGSAMGRRDEDPEETGLKAANDLLNALTTEACVDQHSQDQIIVLMALAEGHSKVRVGEITMHTKTAIYVAEKLTDAKFKITDCEGYLIECDGIGLKT